RKAVIEALHRQLSPSKIAKQYGYNYQRVKAIAAEHNGEVISSPHPLGHLAPPRLRPFVVSVRHIYDHWPEEDFEAIQKARADYDAGLIEMCQGTVIDPQTGERFVAQYAIPRHKPIKREPYFSARSQ